MTKCVVQAARPLARHIINTSHCEWFFVENGSLSRTLHIIVHQTIEAYSTKPTAEVQLQSRVTCASHSMPNEAHVVSRSIPIAAVSLNDLQSIAHVTEE